MTTGVISFPYFKGNVPQMRREGELLLLQPIVLTNSFATCDVYLHIRTSDADPDELQYYTDPDPGSGNSPYGSGFKEKSYNFSFSTKFKF